MPLVRVTLTDAQFKHVDRLAVDAEVEHGEIIRTLVDLDISGTTQCPAKVIDLVGQLYALVVGKPNTKFNSVAEAVPVMLKKNRKGTVTTPEQDEEILYMRERGHTWREIEKHFGIGHGTVFRAAERARKRLKG